MQAVTRSQANISIIHDADTVAEFPPQFFELDYWQGGEGLEGQAAEGKGTTLFLRHDDGQAWAMRHYCRGGGMGWFIRDAYLWSGLKRTRPWKEWHLLGKLQELKLPAPAPVAARVVRSKFIYRADLVMQRIENARIWQDWMREGPLDALDWQALGRVLRRFHNAGVYHHDLNIRNIMRNEDGEVFLIDFDRARIRGGHYWKRMNLDRLMRSINKLQHRGVDLHFEEQHWRQLLQGYMLAVT